MFRSGVPERPALIAGLVTTASHIRVDRASVVARWMFNGDDGRARRPATDGRTDRQP